MKAEKSGKRLILFLAMFMIMTAMSMMVFARSAQAAVVLRPTKLELKVGKTYKLKLSGTTKKATWKSSNRTVATVSSTGVVTGKGAGTAVISAKVSGKTLKCKVTVTLSALSQNSSSSNTTGNGYYIVQAGAFGHQYYLSRQFLKVRQYISDAYWTYKDGVYYIIAGTFLNKSNAVARMNYLLSKGISASVEIR